MHFLPLFLLWARPGYRACRTAGFRRSGWLYVLGEPGLSIPGVLGGFITWVKVVSLFALLAWVMSWVVARVQDPRAGSRPIGSMSPRSVATASVAWSRWCSTCSRATGRLRSIDAGRDLDLDGRSPWLAACDLGLDRAVALVVDPAAGEGVRRLVAVGIHLAVRSGSAWPTASSGPTRHPRARTSSARCSLDWPSLGRPARGDLHGFCGPGQGDLAADPRNAGDPARGGCSRSPG